MNLSKPSLTLSLGALLFASAILAQTTTDREIQKDFDVTGPGKVTVDADRGSIEVRTGNAGKLQVTVTRKVTRGSQQEAEDILRDHEVTFEQNGNNLLVKARFKGQKASGWKQAWNNLQVHYLVTIPRKYDLDLKTTGGSIVVPELEGELRAKTSGGGLQFGDIHGPVIGQTSGGSITLGDGATTADLETSGGGITVSSTAGNLSARTAGGSIKISKAGGDVFAKTSGGGINVAEVAGKIDASTSGGSVSAKLTTQPKGNCSLKTSGGSIDVQLASAIAVDLDASTTGGHVTTDFPIGGGKGKTQIRAPINGGGPALVLRTSGGSVHVRKI